MAVPSEVNITTGSSEPFEIVQAFYEGKSDRKLITLMGPNGADKTRFLTDLSSKLTNSALTNTLIPAERALGPSLKNDNRNPLHALRSIEDLDEPGGVFKACRL